MAKIRLSFLALAVIVRNHPECRVNPRPGTSGNPSDGTVILPDLTAEDVDEFPNTSS
jgi:hypothetical protein